MTLYKTMDSIADYKRDMDEHGNKAPAYTRIVSKSGPPIDAQMADNCSTMSLLGAMKLLFPEKGASGELEAKYESYIIDELKSTYPKLTQAHCDQITELGQQKNDVEWTLSKARMLFAKAIASGPKDPESFSKLTESAKLFEQAKQVLQHNPPPNKVQEAPSLLLEAEENIRIIRQSLWRANSPTGL